MPSSDEGAAPDVPPSDVVPRKPGGRLTCHSARPSAQPLSRVLPVLDLPVGIFLNIALSLLPEAHPAADVAHRYAIPCDLVNLSLANTGFRSVLEPYFYRSLDLVDPNAAASLLDAELEMTLPNNERLNELRQLRIGSSALEDSSSILARQAQLIHLRVLMSENTPSERCPPLRQALPRAKVFWTRVPHDLEDLAFLPESKVLGIEFLQSGVDIVRNKRNISCLAERLPKIDQLHLVGKESISLLGPALQVRAFQLVYILSNWFKLLQTLMSEKEYVTLPVDMSITREITDISARVLNAQVGIQTTCNIFPLRELHLGKNIPWDSLENILRVFPQLETLGILTSDSIEESPKRVSSTYFSYTLWTDNVSKINKLTDIFSRLNQPHLRCLTLNMTSPGPTTDQELQTLFFPEIRIDEDNSQGTDSSQGHEHNPNQDGTGLFYLQMYRNYENPVRRPTEHDQDIIKALFKPTAVFIRERCPTLTMLRIYGTDSNLGICPHPPILAIFHYGSNADSELVGYEFQVVPRKLEASVSGLSRKAINRYIYYG